MPSSSTALRYGKNITVRLSISQRSQQPFAKNIRGDSGGASVLSRNAMIGRKTLKFLNIWVFIDGQILTGRCGGIYALRAKISEKL